LCDVEKGLNCIVEGLNDLLNDMDIRGKHRDRCFGEMSWNGGEPDITV
jgi:hypothetical protein